MAEHNLTCAGCGAQFTYHRRKKYCTPRCRPGLRPKGTDRHANAACRQDHECKMCGIRFKPKQAGRTTCCSRECGVSYQAWVRSLKANGGRVTHRVRRRRCDICDRPFTQSTTETVCSGKCRNHRWRKYYDPVKWRKYYVPVNQAECRECGKEFNRSQDGATRWMCSPECRDVSAKRSRRVARASRKALERGADRGESIDPIKVFERDAWRCGICGRRTHKAKRGTYHDKAPELDHIVALANGGAHTWDNVQCSCRACNGAKGAADYGQLTLFPAA